jgi:YVTN family beta-propeller protein
MKTAAVLLLCSRMVLLGAESTPQTSLLVLSKGDHTLSVVDPAARKVIARMPSGPEPHEVVASSDGKLAFISNYGANNTITVSDLVGQKGLTTIDLGPLHSPHGLMFVGGKAWFTAEAAKVIGSIDPATMKVDWILGTGQNRTHMIYVFDDLKRMITSNIASATMTIVDKTARDWDETVIPVGKGAEGFDVSPDHKELWAANAQDSTVSVINLETKKVVETLDANVRSANRLKFTPDGKLVLVSMLNGPDLTVIDVSTRKVVKRIPIGHGAAGIQMQPDGARAYVSCTPDSYVAVVDLKTLDVAGKLDAGKQPDGLAWAVQR